MRQNASVTDPFKGVEELARGLVNEGRYCTALQVSVGSSAGRLSLAVGELAPGELVREDSMFSVYCVAKPILALAAVSALEESGKTLLSPICEVVSDDSAFTVITHSVLSALNHTAALGSPSLGEIHLSPLRHREEVLRRGIASATPGYSEYSSQVLLCEIIEYQSGRSATSFLESSLLTNLGLAGVRYRFDPDELENCRSTIGYYTVGLQDAPVPLLHDRSPHLACLDRAALGPYVSANTLRSWYEAVGRVYAGGEARGLPSSRTLRSVLSAASPLAYHRTLQRSGRFSGGFMIDLEDHGFGNGPGHGAFGHSGFLGASFGFFDPTSGVAGAGISNGLHLAIGELDRMRGALVAAMIACSR